MVLWPALGDGHLGVLDSKVGISNVERKRKMPVREKGPKEPLHFNVAGVAKGGLNFLHPRSSKGKEAAHNP